VSGDEAEPVPEVISEALPALSLLQELLADRYVFHDTNQQPSWNLNELEQTSKRKITLPMSETKPRSLLTALEQSFAPKTEGTDPKKVIKKFWPSPWSKPVAKVPRAQKNSALSVAGPFFHRVGPSPAPPPCSTEGSIVFEIHKGY
jgi:hypothetical protein